MDNIIKQIMDIISDNDGAILKIKFYRDGEVEFDIYEIEIPIIVSKKDKSVYLDCEWVSGSKLNADMLHELWLITKSLEDNIDNILDLI